MEFVEEMFALENCAKTQILVSTYLRNEGKRKKKPRIERLVRKVNHG